jgi:hypothetical protein
MQRNQQQSHQMNIRLVLLRLKIFNQAFKFQLIILSPVSEDIPLTHNGSKHTFGGRLGHAQSFCGHQAEGGDDSIKACLSIIIKDDCIMASVAQIIIGNSLQKESTVDSGTRAATRVPWTESIV